MTHNSALMKRFEASFHRARPARPPHIVAIGGTTRSDSSTERALRLALAAAEEGGARTSLFTGPSLDLPLYAPERRERTPEAIALIEGVRTADALILGSPSYHGGISGLVKNAIDYAEDLSKDVRPYFDGRPVGCVTTAGGGQGAMTTLAALRDVVHALRGWNTPIGVAINTAEPVFDAEGRCVSPRVSQQIGLLVEQLMFLSTAAVEEHSASSEHFFF